jgi:hypothetical protein
MESEKHSCKIQTGEPQLYTISEADGVKGTTFCEDISFQYHPVIFHITSDAHTEHMYIKPDVFLSSGSLNITNYN